MSRAVSLLDVRKSRWTPLGMALLCGHCALTGLLALAGLAGAGAAPVLLGVDVNYVWPPFFILGAFGLWLWSGRPRTGDAEAHACPLPDDR